MYAARRLTEATHANSPPFHGSCEIRRSWYHEEAGETNVNLLWPWKEEGQMPQSAPKSHCIARVPHPLRGRETDRFHRSVAAGPRACFPSPFSGGRSCLSFIQDRSRSRSITSGARLAWCAPLFLLALGCNPQLEIQEEQLDRGAVVLLPGIGGEGWQLAGTVAGLRDAGVDQSLEIIPWGTIPIHPLQHLTDLRANLKRAKKIATRLVELKRERPDSPVTLMGVSGGGGLAVLSVEALPDNVQIDRLILVAAAISKDYDLTKAKARCRDKVFNFYSTTDGVVGIGTEMFGTIDRKTVWSAGYCGFVDAQGELLDYDWLEQIPWEEAWFEYGHFGDHMGYRSRPWARYVLAPCLPPSRQ